MEKICSKCKIHLLFERFQKDPRYKDGYCSWCKECKKANARLHKGTNLLWCRNHTKQVNKTKAKYVNNNLEKVKKAKAKWRKNNPKIALAGCRKYQAAKVNATPKWLSKDHLKEMQDFYMKTPKGFHVDHIEPIQGKNVRGLHVPWNLQYLPAALNQAKSNKS